MNMIHFKKVSLSNLEVEEQVEERQLFFLSVCLCVCKPTAGFEVKPFISHGSHVLTSTLLITCRDGESRRRRREEEDLKRDRRRK